jgi:hypothetical protein
MCAFPFLGRFGRSPCPVFSCVSFVCCIHLYTSMRLRSQQSHPGSPGAPNGAPMGSPAPRASPAASGPRSPACMVADSTPPPASSHSSTLNNSAQAFQPTMPTHPWYSAPVPTMQMSPGTHGIAPSMLQPTIAACSPAPVANSFHHHGFAAPGQNMQQPPVAPTPWHMYHAGQPQQVHLAQMQHSHHLGKH